MNNCRNSLCQFSKVADRNCGQNSAQVNAWPCARASALTSAAWATNCPIQETTNKPTRTIVSK